jgi:hypothetical protein
VFRVTDVKKPLLTVRQLAEQGNEVVLPVAQCDVCTQNAAAEGEYADQQEGHFLRDRSEVRQAG